MEGERSLSERAQTPGPQRAAYLILAVIVACGSLSVSFWLSNVSFWIAIAASLMAGVFAIGNLVGLVMHHLERPFSLLPFQKAVLTICGCMAVVIGTELLFKWSEQGGESLASSAALASLAGVGYDEPGKYAAEMGLPLLPEAKANIARRRGVLTLAPEWELQFVSVPRASSAYTWHGALHVHDENRFRRMTPFPPKRSDRFRLMFVGDSMTYGYGVDEQFIYVSLLERELGKEFKIEVLNLGILGWQSEDILNIVRRFVPELHPDLVFYGVNHNDFLPSGVGQYLGGGYEFPLPDKVKDFFVEHSRFAGFVSDAYDASLRSAGLRADFFDDILADFDGYQKRFASDVSEMNRFVTGQGLPPIVSMVIDQFPAYGGREYRITKAAERYMAQAGMEVIQTEEYYERFDGLVFRVSPWEGHTDEEGHAIFAAMILQELETRPALERYRRNVEQSSTKS